MAAIEARVSELGQRLRGQLDDLKGVSTHDLGERQCGIVTFTKDEINASHLHQSLQAQKMNISQALFTSARLDFSRRQLSDTARASVHYFNTDAEIDQFVAAVDSVNAA